MTEVLAELRAGREGAREELFRVLLSELRRIAGAHMRGQSSEHTLQPTALVNEAYMRLLGGRSTDWKDRAHFLATASRAMRSILIDHARARGAARRGGERPKPLVHADQAPITGPNLDLLALDEALTKFAAISPERAQVVELKFFGGLTNEETARVLGVAERTVYRMWEYSRAWLHTELKS
ncbi:MAG: ECF-type sigma factor [Planctomycetota bacterium]